MQMICLLKITQCWKKETKADLNKWSDILPSWTEKLKLIKMSVLSNWCAVLTQSLSISQQVSLVHIDKIILKFWQKIKWKDSLY
jgi:hypothetical protein